MKTTLLRNGRFLDELVLSSKKLKSFCQLGKMKFALLLMLLANLFFTDHAAAQIALRGAATVSTTTNATLTITKPTGLAVNDIMFAHIGQSNDNSNAMGNATRTGWTALNGVLYGSSGSDRWHATVLYKVADATDVAAANFAFTLNANSDDGQGAITAYSGVNVSSPFDVTVTTLNGASNAVGATGFTTVTPNTAILMFGALADNVAFANWSTATSPGTLTELYDEAFNATADMALGGAAALKATAGATGNGTCTLGTSETWNGVLVALKPVTISTGTITGSPFCAGNSISVPYTIAGPYNTTNTFTAQLSNASGSFASPVTLGSVANTNTAGTISGTIPGGTAAGTGYRVRVISSLPAATGTDNGVNITINTAATASAGSAFNACSTATNIAIGTGATANGTVNWTSNGTGTITNSTSLNGATYTPGVGEASTVTFTLTATAASPCTGTANSNKVMTLVAPPTATAGGTATICQNGTHVVVGATSSNGTISWAENGAGSITAGGTTNAPTYTAAAGDAGNNVTLTMTVSNGTCTNATATYTIHVNGSATAVAGTAVITCETAGAVNITTGSTSTNNAGVTWSSSGTGTFTNVNSMTLATYDPSPADITAGSVTLTLTATGNAPCGNATSNKTFTIRKLPTATAGGSATICQNQTHQVVGATSSNGTISWIENGAGSITAGGTTNAPTYTAAAGDAGNTVTLTMSVTNSPCATATATYTINVLGSATAVAGTAVSTCSNAAVNITAGSSSVNNSSITWTSNGTGTIANANSLTLATYTPGPSEAGTVILTLTATGNSPCGNAVSTKNLTVLAVPVATGVVICQGSASAAMTSATVCPNGSSVSTGNTNPGTGASVTGIGSVAWTNPGNVAAAGNATSNLNAGNDTNYLRATNYGFALPANATVGGILVTINRFASQTAGVGCRDEAIYLVKNNVIQTATDKATTTTWPTALGTATYGSASDLWGGSWTVADINNGNFGVAMSAHNNGALTSRVATVDYIQVSVTYTVPGSLNWYTVSSGGSSIGTGSSFNPVGVAGSGLANTNTAATTTYYVECSSVAGCRTPVNYVINALPTVSFSGLAASYCGIPPSVTLTGNHAPAGSFTGAGITDNGNGTATFNPATAGAGSHAIVYSYTDGNTCVNTDTQNVSITAPTTYYADADGDGFGNPLVTEQTCSGPSVGFVADNTDCDDAVLYYADVDGDGFGSTTFVNCGGVLNNTDCDDAVLNYADVDGDGFGSTTFVNCGGVLNNTDCDDAVLHYADVDGDGFGSTTFVNCGGVLNNTDCNDNQLQYLDNDGDGFGSVTLVACGGVLNNTDCDDNNNAIYQSASLFIDADADGYDNGSAVICYGAAVPAGYSLTSNGSDCNDNNNTLHATYPFYADADGDGFGAGSLVSVCAIDANTPPTGYSLNGTDCNDADNSIYQSASLFIDVDADGYDNGSTVVCYGASVPTGYSLTSNGSDCNDNDNTMHATYPFYADADGDGFGAGSLISICAVDANTPPTGYSLDGTDCNDSNNAMHQTFPFYADTDGDTYGAGSLVSVCAVDALTPPAGYSLNNTDCNDAVFAINPGHAEVLYNGVDDNCDNNLDEGNHLTTSLLPASCGATLASIGSLIGITTVAGHPITGYRIRATNGAEVQIIEKTVPHFTMALFPSHAYATTYTIEIELQRAGVWLGYYGSSCQVSTPAILAEGGAASVSPSQCGSTLTKINTLIATTSLQGVTGYRFRVTNITDPFGPNAVQVLDRTQNWFSLQMLARYNYGTTYQIEVAVKTTGTYGGFGSPCEVISPAVPSLINCGGTVAAGTTTVAATSLAGATQYRFQITRQLDNATSTIDRSTNYFTFNMVPPVTFTAGALYSVRVAVMTTGTWSPFGDACEITAPGGGAKGVPATIVETATQTEFKAAAYPNPFTADFNIDVTTSSQENVELKVYDMIGKLIEFRNVKATELNMEKVGAQYPSGVYNVIVSQDGIVKTLRVIKR